MSLYHRFLWLKAHGGGVPSLIKKSTKKLVNTETIISPSS